jgi:regulator of replication initiation timing
MSLEDQVNQLTARNTLLWTQLRIIQEERDDLLEEVSELRHRLEDPRISYVFNRPRPVNPTIDGCFTPRPDLYTPPTPDSPWTF